MIVIFYPGGGFGSTIEYSLRHFSDNFTYADTEVTDTGSMHSFIKDFHPSLINNFLNVDINLVEIATPRYPDQFYYTVYDTIKEFQRIIDSKTKVIFVTLDSSDVIERNWLFLRYKTKNFLNYIVSKQIPNIKQWNSDYTHFNNMQPWEQRELYSFLIRDSIVPFKQARSLALDNWLLITPDDILFNFEQSINKIFEYLKIQFVNRGLLQFYDSWFKKQKYILDEYAQVNAIIDSVLTDCNISWKPMSLMAESIVQYRLSNLGYDLKCFGLNQFPTNTTQLSKYI